MTNSAASTKRRYARIVFTDHNGNTRFTSTTTVERAERAIERTRQYVRASYQGHPDVEQISASVRIES